MPIKETIYYDNKIFRFYDILDNDQSQWCDVEIKIKELVYDNDSKFYDITYNYYDNFDLIEFDNASENRFIKNKANPFYYKCKMTTPDMINGVIVVKNSMTDEMIKYLLMDYEELDKYIGNTWGVQYKANIMFALALMWD